jgi:hypothetical protein
MLRQSASQGEHGDREQQRLLEIIPRAKNASGLISSKTCYWRKKEVFISSVFSSNKGYWQIWEQRCVVHKFAKPHLFPTSVPQ